MAITAASAGTPLADTGNASSYATASWTPTANRLILVAVTTSDTVSTATPTLSGNGLTWVQVLSQNRADLVKRVTVFRAYHVSGGSAGALTADYAGDSQSGTQIHISEWAGTAGSGDNGSSAIVQSVGATWISGTPLVTLAAFADATNNAAYGAFEHNADPSIGSGFTNLAETTYASPTSFALTEYVIGEDTSVDAGGGSGSGVGIAIEIAVAVAAATRIPYRNPMPTLIAQ